MENFDDMDMLVDEIIALNQHLYDFWSKSSGWSPRSAAHLLSVSRLDWQVSLSRTLKLWVNIEDEDGEPGQLILAWSNLGSLLEGTMKWYLSVFKDDYDREPLLTSNGNVLAPEGLNLGKLQSFFEEKVWSDRQIQEWGHWIDRVRRCRNAVHAYQNRDIGTFDEYRECVCKYREFLIDLDMQVPYPDEYAFPRVVWEIWHRPYPQAFRR